MEYYAQSPNACIAYSLLQLGVVDKEAVSEYEQAVSFGMRWDRVRDWLLTYAPDYWEKTEDMRSWTQRDNPPGRRLPRKGRGVAVLEWSTQGVPYHHAVSFEDGKLLDPLPEAPGIPETWAQLRRRWLEEGNSPVIIHTARV